MVNLERKNRSLEEHHFTMFWFCFEFYNADRPLEDSFKLEDEVADS